MSEILKLKEEKAALSQENRELLREKLAMKRRLAEVEEILADKGTLLELAQKELQQTYGMQSSLSMLEEKNRKLVADNQEYVNQMIQMKESRA